VLLNNQPIKGDKIIPTGVEHQTPVDVKLGVIDRFSCGGLKIQASTGSSKPLCSSRLFLSYSGSFNFSCEPALRWLNLLHEIPHGLEFWSKDPEQLRMIHLEKAGFNHLVETSVKPRVV